MRLSLNLVVSLVLLAVCTWLVWPNAAQREDMAQALVHLDWAEQWPYFAGYLGLLAASHFFRAWRWNNLLRPIGVDLPAGKLLAYSSIGFMAIMALPARLGEFARPALVRQKGRVSAAAVLGTVAVERIVDGLVVSLIVFACFWSLRGPDAASWMMPVAWLSLAVFVAAVLFLAFALKWPERTVRFAVAATGIPWLAPGLGGKLARKLELMISGFRVLRDGRNLASFVGSPGTELEFAL